VRKGSSAILKHAQKEEEKVFTDALKTLTAD